MSLRFITEFCNISYSPSKSDCAFSLFSSGIVEPQTSVLASFLDVEKESRKPSITSACVNTR